MTKAGIILRQTSGDEVEVSNFIRSCDVLFDFRQKYLFKTAQKIIDFRAVDYALERLRPAISLQVAPLRRAPEAIGRKLNNYVPLCLHDLVQRVLLRGPEEHADLAFIGPPLDVRQRRFGTIRQSHRNIVHLVNETARMNKSEDAGVLRNPLRGFQDRIDRQFLEQRTPVAPTDSSCQRRANPAPL